jgi:methyl-accepting chemotaxis protein
MAQSTEILKAKLHAWSKETSGERSDLVAQLASALDDPELKSRWSLIDIRREIEARSDSQTRRRNFVLNVVNVAHTAGYLFPVGFTWFHLSTAMREFRKAADALGSGEALNFLSFWTGADASRYSGMKLQTVGILIVFFLAVPIVLSFFFNYLETKQSKISSELNDLILQTQLEFSTARTITPEALADALSDSTMKLEVALTQMSSAVKATEETISAIGRSTESLETATTKSSNALAFSSAALETQIRNLESSFGKIGDVVGSLSSIGQDIASAGQTIRSIGDMAGSAERVESKMIDALNSATSASTSLTSVSESLQRDLSGLGEQLFDQVSAMSKMIESLTSTISPLVSDLKALGQVTDDNKPAILHLGDVVIATKRVVDQMNSVVQEFAAAASSISTMTKE